MSIIALQIIFDHKNTYSLIHNSAGTTIIMVNKIRWGVLSSAKIAREKIIPGIMSSSNGSVLGIGSRRLEDAEKISKKFNIRKAYGSYEELLNDQEIDAVYIPLPNQVLQNIRDSYNS